jgi:hypothetical protein
MGSAMKELLDRAGEAVAQFYVATLGMIFILYPFIFGGFFVYLAAITGDAIGVGHLGIISFISFVVFVFLHLCSSRLLFCRMHPPVVNKSIDALK